MRRRSLLALNLALASTTSVTQASLAGEPVGRVWTPESIPWQSVAANGTKYALLEGRRDIHGGAFTYAFFIPAGVWDTPHWHSSTARVVVLKGALGLGYGDVLDRSRAQQYGPGTFLEVPGGAKHFDGADIDTIILGVATGPWSTTYLDRSSPASAGTPVASPSQKP